MNESVGFPVWFGDFIGSELSAGNVGMEFSLWRVRVMLVIQVRGYRVLPADVVGVGIKGSVAISRSTR